MVRATMPSKFLLCEGRMKVLVLWQTVDSVDRLIPGTRWNCGRLRGNVQLLTALIRMRSKCLLV